jgi:hypothetical protein
MEFALLVPVMLTMYIGTVEITEAYYVDRRLTLATAVIGDLIARDGMDNQPLSYWEDRVRLGMNPFAPAKIAGTKIRMTYYGIDAGGPAGKLRAFVDWQVTCTVAGYDGAGSPQVACTIGSSAPFIAGLPRCEIDATIDPNLLYQGKTMIRVEAQYTHVPILAGLFSNGSGASWLSFMSASGFLLQRTYYTWPRLDLRSEGPIAPNMPVKANASPNQDLPPPDPTVCGASGIPVLQRFIP